ncbi:uncharacterized protein PSFLO_06790 [Pseudozyma flocculosa]|uniref:Uncharacterized protein n=1 Tax=Pseudozyma flocculosa TaxID=84751 RepID=A0A5C3FA22_9BASI|nr:uncharacterized protein PSFLO_06790 [Pseudozyma flocculosa]
MDGVAAVAMATAMAMAMAGMLADGGPREVESKGGERRPRTKGQRTSRVGLMMDDGWLEVDRSAGSQAAGERASGRAGERASERAMRI